MANVVVAPEEVPECDRCGLRHLTMNGKQSCPAHISSGAKRGQPCSHEPGYGTEHKGVGTCKFHGGSTPNANKNAAKIKIEQEARKMLGLTEWEPITDPFSALADLAGKALALQEIMHAKVEELASLRQSGGVTGEKIDLTYEAWERAIDRCLKVLNGMARLDLDAKIAKLKAAVDLETAGIIERALATALGRIEITQEDRTNVLQEFGALLRPQELEQESIKHDAM